MPPLEHRKGEERDTTVKGEEGEVPPLEDRKGEERDTPVKEDTAALGVGDTEGGVGIVGEMGTLVIGKDMKGVKKEEGVTARVMKVTQ